MAWHVCDAGLTMMRRPSTMSSGTQSITEYYFVSDHPRAAARSTLTFMSRGEKRRLRLFKSTDVRWVRLDDPVVPHDRKAELAVLSAMIDQLILALVPRKAEGDGIVQPRRDRKSVV